jgi:hypothetical protein
MKTLYTNERQLVTLVAALPRWALRGEVTFAFLVAVVPL